MNVEPSPRLSNAMFMNTAPGDLHCLDLFREVCIKVEERLSLLRASFHYGATREEDAVSGVSDRAAEFHSSDLGPGEHLEDLLQVENKRG